MTAFEVSVSFEGEVGVRCVCGGGGVWRSCTVAVGISCKYRGMGLTNKNTILREAEDGHFLHIWGLVFMLYTSSYCITPCYQKYILKGTPCMSISVVCFSVGFFSSYRNFLSFCWQLYSHNIYQYKVNDFRWRAWSRQLNETLTFFCIVQIFHARFVTPK